MRAFVALDLPDALRDAIARLQAGLAVGRVVAEDNLHLTLAFLGDIPDVQARALAEALAARALSPVTLRLRGLDLFGGRKPSVLFIAATGDGLDRLHDKVMRAARGAGIALPRTRFRPHVTLARFPKEMAPKEHERLGEYLSLNAGAALAPVPADRVTLYRSQLRHEGTIHEPLAEFPLPG